MKLKADDLLKIRGVELINAEKIRNTVFTGVSIGSKNVKKGEIFAAIKGERFDGHDFIKEVFKKGVIAVLVSKKWYKKQSKSSFKNKSLIVVEDTIEGLGEIARIYRKKFLIPVLGIAGSNGKTSTKDIIADVLSKKYNVLKTEGNFNNAIGVPLTLFRLNEEHRFCVIELGTNHFGEIEYLCNIAKPQFGTVTNIGKEHLEFLKNIKGAAKAEGELVEYLKKIYGTYFLNDDDKYLRKIPGKDRMHVFSFGTSGKANVTGRIIKFNTFYPEIEIKYNKHIIRTKLNTIGYQSFLSALNAAAIGFYFEVPAFQIKKALSEFTMQTGKRNALKNINGIWVIDDTYNSNPDSVITALENISRYTIKGKKHIVLSDMLELGKSSRKEHTEIGRLIKKMKFENLYTYGEESYYTFKGSKGLKNNYYFSDKPTLAEFLRLNIKKGDAVLIKGSRSMKMEEIIEQISVNI